MWTECANKPNYFIAFLTVKLLTSPTNKDPDTRTCNGFSLLKALLQFAFNQLPNLRGDKLICFFLTVNWKRHLNLDVVWSFLSLIFHQLYFKIMKILNSLQYIIDEKLMKEITKPHLQLSVCWLKSNGRNDHVTFKVRRLSQITFMKM